MKLTHSKTSRVLSGIGGSMMASALLSGIYFIITVPLPQVY